MSVLSLPKPALLIDDLDLLVEHLPGEAVDRHMHPIMLFAFHDEIVLRLVALGLK
jgi:hypothetical protein